MAGLLLAIWEPTALGELRVQIVFILSLAVANFYLHVQVLMRRPVLAPVVYISSAADIGVISLIVATAGGFDSGLYVFYFPALVVMSVAFRPPIALGFGTSAIAIYSLISLPAISAGDWITMITRLMMLAAVTVCGSVYWQIERNRRRAAALPRVSVDNKSWDAVPSR